MKVADAIWVATALLHKENPSANDFSVNEIVHRAVKENFVDGYKPGLQVHASKHCVANKSPNPGRYRMLYETTRGRRRLIHFGDDVHPGRTGKTMPNRADLPSAYHDLIDWFEQEYFPSVQPGSPAQEGSRTQAGLEQLKQTMSRMSPEQLEDLRRHILSVYGN